MIYRILYIHHGRGIGGAPLSLLYLIQQLDRTQYEPVVLCLYESSAADLYRAEGVETHVARGVRTFDHSTLLWYNLRRPWRLPWRLLTFWPSVVLSSWKKDALSNRDTSLCLYVFARGSGYCCCGLFTCSRAASTIFWIWAVLG